MAEKDYSKLASIIIENVGGKENIAGLIHCITRSLIELASILKQSMPYS